MATKRADVPPVSIPLKDLLPGYPKLAGKMGLTPEKAMFRRFGALNAQMLLYMQAELVYLEKELRKVELDDSQSEELQKKEYTKDCLFLIYARNDKQMQLVMEIRAKLKDYNEALKLQFELVNMPYPSKSDVEYLQAYLETPDMGPFIMSGTDADIWGSLEEYRAPVPDLVALYGRHNEDPFSKWVTSTGMDIFFRCGFSRWRKPSRVSGITGYPESTLLRITRWISSIIASLLPVLSIIVLYCVDSMLARLGIIASFNVFVSLCLLGFTNAKSSEVFAVAAAFAAVQVVFISNNGTGAVSGNMG